MTNTMVMMTPTRTMKMTVFDDVTFFMANALLLYKNLKGISHPSPPSPPRGLIVFRVRALPHRLAENQNVDNFPRSRLPLGRWMI